MNLETVKKIKSLADTANKLGSLYDNYRETIKDSNCDKHNLAFGGDDRFAIFKCSVYLDCHTGYYGSSKCSRYVGRIDDDTAKRLLNKVLNKRMREILQAMADEARLEASLLQDEARKEIEALSKVVESIHIAMDKKEGGAE